MAMEIQKKEKDNEQLVRQI